MGIVILFDKTLQKSDELVCNIGVTAKMEIPLPNMTSFRKLI